MTIYYISQDLTFCIQKVNAKMFIIQIMFTIQEGHQDIQELTNKQNN